MTFEEEQQILRNSIGVGISTPAEIAKVARQKVTSVVTINLFERLRQSQGWSKEFLNMERATGVVEECSWDLGWSKAYVGYCVGIFVRDVYGRFMLALVFRGEHVGFLSEDSREKLGRVVSLGYAVNYSVRQCEPVLYQEEDPNRWFVTVDDGKESFNIVFWGKRKASRFIVLLGVARQMDELAQCEMEVREEWVREKGGRRYPFQTLESEKFEEVRRFFG